MPFSIVISCEHASAVVPSGLAARFADADGVLTTHRAWDAGAAAIARMLASRWKAPLFEGEVTRLVCDLNRSEGNRTLWSEWTADLPPEEKKAMLDRWYHPYRRAVTQAVAAAVRGGGCLHLSVHSFTPIWHGKERRVDLGLLYDPARAEEKNLSLALRADMAVRLPTLRVRRNAPYRGVSDSLTTALHNIHPADLYVALELEFNQGGRFPSADTETAAGAFHAVAPPLAEALEAGLAWLPPARRTF